MKKELREVCAFYSGTGFPVKYQGKVEDELPFYKVGDIAINVAAGNIYLKVCNNYISREEAKEIKGAIIPANTIVFAKIGEALKLNRRAITSKECLIDNNTIGISPMEGKLEIKYFFYLMQNLKMEQLAESTTVPSVRKSKLEEVVIEVPSINEQVEIGMILDKVFTIIQLRKQQLNDFDNLIKSRFVEMFGNPIINPKGWSYKPLSKCLENIENGKSFVCENSCRIGGFPAILKLSAATYGVYNPNENKALTDENLFVKAAEVHNGDLIFTRKNTPDLVGMCAYVYETPPKLMMPDLIFRLNTKENCNKIYLWKLINHEFFRGKIKSLASGSAQSMSNISKERLMSLEIPLPQIELQNQFAAFVQQVDKLKFDVQKSLDELQQLFDSLMDKYFG